MNDKFPNESVASALYAVLVSQREALARIEAAYPTGCEVRVHHYHGAFYATVVGHCCNEFGFYHLGYVSVINNASGKRSRRYYTNLEVL